MKFKSPCWYLFISFLCLPGYLWAQPMQNSQSNPSRIANKPNIVLFVADDLGARDVGAYGNSVVRTPHIDQLADESLLFKQAFASSPTCSPSRSTLYTGMMPFHNGAHNNHSGVKEGIQSLPDYMKPLGYRVALAGKFHVGPMKSFPFELIHNSNVPEPGHKDDGVLWTNLNMGAVDKWLSKVGKDQPFMLVVNDHSPHVIWPEQARYDFEKVNIPSKHIDTEDTRKSRARYYTDISKMDRNLGQLRKSLQKYGFSENTIVIFTSDQGPQWAFAKWTLYDYGIRVPLLVHWPGTTKTATQTNALTSLADLLPTFVEIGGNSVPTNIDGKSILPVLKNNEKSHRERVFATHTGDGRMNRSPARMLRTERYKYILNLAPDLRFTTHMDKAKDHDGGREYWDSWVIESYRSEHAASVLWRYHNRPEEELYDLHKDPNETKNLAKKPEYSDLLDKFRKQLSEWRKQQGDQESGPYEAPKRKNEGPVAPYIFR